MTDVEEKKVHRSVSQINQYTKCPYSYYLDRIEKVWSRPAAWLAQGSAVHVAAEMFERSERKMTLEEMEEVFRESYVEEIAKYTEDTPNFEYWFASGPYGGEVDIERRHGIGLEQCGKYINWYDEHPEEVIWVADDGTPGIEIGFDIELDGVPVRGYIDAVIQVEDKVIVRDNKTGNQPGDDFQLGTYKVALEEQFGVEGITEGDYWMGRSGKPTYAYDLTEWTREAVTSKFHELEANIQAGNFEPDPEPSKCRFCSVSTSCSFFAM